MGFADSIRANVAKRLAQIDAAAIEQADDLFRHVVSFSPTQPSANFAKGEFINNWMIGFNAIEGGSRGDDYSGIGSLNDISRLRGSRVFYGRDYMVTLTNNVDYGFRVEYAGWPAPQWSGRIGPSNTYAPIAKAFIAVVPKYQRP